MKVKNKRLPIRNYVTQHGVDALDAWIRSLAETSRASSSQAPFVPLRLLTNRRISQLRHLYGREKRAPVGASGYHPPISPLSYCWLQPTTNWGGSSADTAIIRRVHRLPGHFIIRIVKVSWHTAHCRRRRAVPVVLPTLCLDSRSRVS